jgi:glycine/D-amino acid oxidase-like deaminating enzyme
MQRRDFFLKSGATLGTAAMVAGTTAAVTSVGRSSAAESPAAAEVQTPRMVAAAPAAVPVIVPPLPMVRAQMDRIIKLTVCTRPFRAQGPRLDVEQIGRKTVVHNYGHGGSGWSLSWGSASIAASKALSTGAKEIAVIGCGVVGMTSAITLQRAGVKVTIYAAERPPEIRSMWATGVWSPDSRICLQENATPEFKALWAQMARTSFRAYSSFLGLAGTPVEWTDTYELSDIPIDQAEAESDARGTIKFAESLQKEMTPEIQAGIGGVDLPPGSHSFGVPYVRRSTNMHYNLPSYMRLLMSDFRADGGEFVVRAFSSPGEFNTLPQKTIVSCPGYGARALFKDESVIPVRGQLNRLIPQPEINYTLNYGNVFMVPRRDGIVLQYGGIGGDEGWNNPSVAPDWDEAARAVASIAKLNSLSARQG